MITSLKLAVVAAAALAVTSALSAKASVIADWTFETSLPTTAGPFSPEVGAGSALGSHAGASTYSNPAGNGSAHSFSSNTWAVGDYYEFDVTTTGAPGIFLSFDQTSSGTGPKNFEIEVSTDGTAFSNFASYSVLANASPNPVWNATTGSSLYTTTADLSAIVGLKAIRLVNIDTVSAAGGTVAAGGTDRVDNVIVQTTAFATPEPASIGVLGAAGIALLARRRK